MILSKISLSKQKVCVVYNVLYIAHLPFESRAVLLLQNCPSGGHGSCALLPPPQSVTHNTNP